MREQQRSRGISPVIGVIILIGLVITATGAVTLFMGGAADSLIDQSPDVEVSGQVVNDTVVFTHGGGDPIDPSNTGALLITGGDYESATWNEGLTDQDVNTSEIEVDGSVGAAQVIVTVENPAPGDTIRVVWVSDDRSSQETIGEFAIPE